MRALLPCVLCVAVQLVVSLPLEPSGVSVQEQQPREQQETLETLNLGDPRHDVSARDKRTIGFLRQLFPGLSQSEVNPEAENQVVGAESQQHEVRVQYTDPGQSAQQIYSDQEEAASGGNDNPAVAVDGDAEEDPRNKRYLSFGFGADSSSSSSSSSSGSGGGSGNFLFDIIRLVAGSGNTDSGDDGKPAEVSGAVQAEKDDGYQAGIPGPITRLFIVVNRGIANLVQDLILRLAQTSERIVNFKARLITAII